MIRMNLLSEALDGLGRWYVAIPPFLIISFLAALFFVTGEGQERLREAGERLQTSAARENAIEALQNSLARSVAAQRGFLLTRDPRYLEPYDRAVAEVEPQLENLRLRRMHGVGRRPRRQVRDLHVLIGKEAGGSIDDCWPFRKSQERSRAAVALVKTNAGADTDARINDILERVARSRSRLSTMPPRRTGPARCS